MNISPRNQNTLLGSGIEGYGIFNKEKMEIFIEKKDNSSRFSLIGVFLNGEHAESNAKALVRHAWNFHLKKKYEIPELLGIQDIRSTIGRRVYGALGLGKDDISQLLGKCLDDFGIFDDAKMQVYISNSGQSERLPLNVSFFSGEHAEQNAISLIRYAWENVWKNNSKPIPELMRAADIQKTCGTRIYSALNTNKPSELLEKVFDDYGVLDVAKATALLEGYDSIDPKLRSSSDSILFDPNNPLAKDNAENYLTAYQQKYQKRKSDLDQNDLDRLPELVKDLLSLTTVKDLKSVREVATPKRDSDYNVIQIRWPLRLEKKLTELISDAEDPAEFIRNNPDVMWEQLGITSFAAHMKAQELKLIPSTVAFGNGTKVGFPTYPLIEFPGYEFKNYALKAASSIGDANEIDTHLFVTPIHNQNLHVNVPMHYKGIKTNDYTNDEWAILQTIGLYLHNANLFEKAEKKVRKQTTIYEYKTPSKLDITPRIAPVRVDGELLTQVFLPTRYSKDPGGVCTAVLSTEVNGQKKEIYLFRHNGPGIIAK